MNTLIIENLNTPITSRLNQQSKTSPQKFKEQAEKENTKNYFPSPSILSLCHHAHTHSPELVALLPLDVTNVR